MDNLEFETGVNKFALFREKLLRVTGGLLRVKGLVKNTAKCVRLRVDSMTPSEKRFVLGASLKLIGAYTAGMYFGHKAVTSGAGAIGMTLALMGGITVGAVAGSTLSVIIGSRIEGD
ncbi:MAG: hypothetical protein ABIE03_03930 [Patescibacteria group bacterium]|nr:hypothetical protein [Patescibacteria group bacterium]